MRMVGSYHSILAGLCLAGIGCATANAQQADCRPYPEIARLLDQKFHERPVSQAVVLGENGKMQVFIMFASPLGSTWTAVMADAKGERACLLMGGVQFVIDRQRPTGPAT